MWLHQIFVVAVLARVDGLGCDDIELISRDQWGARAPTSVDYITLPVNMTFVHHTAGSTCSDLQSCSERMRAIQNFHMDDRGWFDIGYNFLVGEDGRTYEGRGWNREGAHTRGYNRVAIAVSVMGSFTSTLPNGAAIQALRNTLLCGVELGMVTPGHEMFGHRDAGCTECPGQTLYEYIQNWPNFSTRDIPKYC